MSRWKISPQLAFPASWTLLCSLLLLKTMWLFSAYILHTSLNKVPFFLFSALKLFASFHLYQLWLFLLCPKAKSSHPQQGEPAQQVQANIFLPLLLRGLDFKLIRNPLVTLYSQALQVCLDEAVVPCPSFIYQTWSGSKCGEEKGLTFFA